MRNAADGINAGIAAELAARLDRAASFDGNLIWAGSSRRLADDLEDSGYPDLADAMRATQSLEEHLTCSRSAARSLRFAARHRHGLGTESCDG